jgi:glycosyltransferase involved in cell wall biosynthesis
MEAGHEVLLAAPGNSTCDVPHVPGMEHVDPVAGIAGDTVSELCHVVDAYAAMHDMDVIHDHTLGGPLYRHRPEHIPVVTTNHGPFDSRLNPLYRDMDRDTAIVAISHHQASTADGVEITRVIHHGIDVDDVPVGTGRGGYAAFLGRMNPTKGPREAIMVARKAGIPLRIAAKMREQEEHDYFDAEIAPLLDDEVEYVGEVDNGDKYRFLGDALALLNPIQWPEPFGLVMIEALASGTPVVATSDGSVPEIVDDGRTGYVRDDDTGLADALREAERLDRRECRQVAETRFSTRRMVDDHVALYAELVSSS